MNELKMSRKSVYWVGTRSPITESKVSDALLNPLNLHREAPDLHGSFDSVNLMEVDLGSLENWKLVLDQAIRLLNYDGPSELTLRFTESKNCTVFQLANFMRARTDFSIEDFEQTVTADRVFIYHFKLMRRLGKPSLLTFDFGIITDGKRNSNVVQFIESIEKANIGHDFKTRVFVCGPLDLLPDLHHEKIEVTEIDGETRFDHKGWITRKKNLILQKSTAENILIAHDRYALPEDFFDRMIEYGADFGVIVPSQRTTKGQRFPDWVTLSSQWSWTPSYLMQGHEFNENMYVNGGLVLAKRHLLLEHPWNELLFWSQGEDVEQSRRMQQAGIVPAYANCVQLEVLEYRDGYIASFERGNPVQEPVKIRGLAAAFLASSLVAKAIKTRPGQALVNSNLGTYLRATNFGAWLGRRLSSH